MPFTGSSLERALGALGELLEARGVTYRLAAVGGGAMLLLGLIARPTDDLDLVAQIEAGDAIGVDPLPAALKEAVTDVDQGPRSKHFADLKALEPTRGELVTAARWTRTHDVSEAFAGELAKVLEVLGAGVADELS